MTESSDVTSTEEQTDLETSSMSIGEILKIRQRENYYFKIIMVIILSINFIFSIGILLASLDCGLEC